MSTIQSIPASSTQHDRMPKSSLVIALAGNPNSGKTSVFNSLTGARQHVANWPGVTVEKKEGTCRHRGRNIHVIDLPGTYSLTPYSTEEVVARDFIIRDKPDVIVNIVDCSNLERNLYLTTQLLELGVPLVLAFNMWDMAQDQQIKINTELLSQMLGLPIVPTVGTKGKGLDELMQAVTTLADNPKVSLAARRSVDYGNEIAPHVQHIEDMLVLQFLLEPSEGLEVLLRHRRHLACELLEGQDATLRLVRALAGSSLEPAIAKASSFAKHIEATLGQPCEIALAQRRYGFISGACAETVERPTGSHLSPSDRIDNIITHPYLGLPIFALLMYMVFQATFYLGNPLVDLLDQGKEHLADFVRQALDTPSTQLLRSLLADGIIEGVGAVLSFLPLIMLLYLAIAILEDSGYMARAAFVLDRLMHRIGLHGKSFIPMLIGFGCTVPAIMATRILETRRDRLTMMLILPLVSCGARMPVYVLLLGALFPPKTMLALGPVQLTNQAMLLFGIYITGIVLAIACTKLLRMTIFRGEITPFVMELPPYRRPTIRGLLVHMWERGWMYVRKAGTIILAIVVVLWAAKTWPQLPPDQLAPLEAQRAALLAPDAPTQDVEQQLLALDAQEHQAQLMHSTIGRVGHALAPAFEPAGMDWKIATAMVGAFAAKEVFVGQMGVIYAVDEDDESSLRQKIAREYTPLQGLCIMLVILIAAPCAATLAVTARESGSWKWAAMQWTYLTCLALVISTVVYQVGSALGYG